MLYNEEMRIAMIWTCTYYKENGSYRPTLLAEKSFKFSECERVEHHILIIIIGFEIPLILYIVISEPMRNQLQYQLNIYWHIHTFI